MRNSKSIDRHPRFLVKPTIHEAFGEFYPIFKKSKLITANQMSKGLYKHMEAPLFSRNAFNGGICCESGGSVST